MSGPRRRLGLRREFLILLPGALLLLFSLSAVTLFAYGSALDRLVDERRAEAASLAARVAGSLGADRATRPTASDLRRLAPQAAGVAVVRADGGVEVAAGELAGATAPPPPADGGDEPLAAGPDSRLPGVVAGFAALAGTTPTLYVRVDLPAAALASQRRGWRILAVVVVAVDVALVLLVVLFFNRLLAPFETLLEQARQVGHPADGADGGGGDDEVAFLVATFERAVAELGRSRTGGEEDELAAVGRTLTGSVQSGLLLLDGEGRLLALNGPGAALLGVGPQVPKTPLADSLSAHPALVEILAAAVATGEAVSRRECEIEVDGEPVTLGLTAHPLRPGAGAAADGGEGGRPLGLLVLFADLTEVQRSERADRLAESLAELGELAAGVAHELRNGLATLGGYLDLIARRPAAAAPLADELAEMRRETDHLRRVVGDFLTFAHPGTTRLEEVRLGDLARRAAADPALAGLAVTVREGGEGGARILGDAQLLERALRNLVRNAAEAQRDAGVSTPIAIALGRSADGVEIAVEDRGGGVPAALRDRLFRPFATGRPGGVGLGLALAQRILALHGGQVRLEDNPGGGTRARVVFPAKILAD